MAIFLTGAATTTYKLGATAVSKIYLGATQVTPAVVAPTDPDFASVSLLLHMDGTGATFVDSSGTPKTVTAGGNATQSATQSRWGGKSAYFDGAGDYVQLSTYGQSALQFSTVQHTVEFWFQTTTTQQYTCLFYRGREGVAASYDYVVNINNASASAGDLALYSMGFGGAMATTGGGWNDGAWHHVAVVRDSGDVFRLYVDGVQRSSRTYSMTQSYSSSSDSVIRIGGDAALSGRDCAGYLDDVRISAVCRYPNGTTFTPPTAAFPNAGPAVAPPSPTGAAQYLIAGGGGAGGGNTGGGGGAGQLLTGTTSFGVGTTYDIVIGSAGISGTANGGNGTASSVVGDVLSLSAAGGGGGGGAFALSARAGVTVSGGSGGGGGGNGSDNGGPAAGGSGTYAGGSSGSSPSSCVRTGGGGGGSGSIGTDASGYIAGVGGSGTVSAITGASAAWAAGGGGGALGSGFGCPGHTAGAGGSGGGGSGSISGNGTAGASNTGSGGGGGTYTTGNDYSGGAGGSGVVIIRTAVDAASISTTGSPTVTTVGGDTVYKFIAAGSITFSSSIPGGGGGGGGGGGAASFVAIPTLTSNTSTGTASTNTTWGGDPVDAWSAFDGSTSTTWNSQPVSSGGEWPAYLQYSFAGGVASQIGGYTLAPYLGGGYDGAHPTAWTFAGSNDGTNFTTLDTQTSISWPSGGSTKEFTLATAASYSVYRWTFTSNVGAGWILISTAQLVEVYANTISVSQQPKNDFSENYSDPALFSVTASVNVGTVAYQWQAYAYNYNTGAEEWFDLTGATSSSFSVRPDQGYSYGLDGYGGGTYPIRVKLTAAGANSVTSSAVHWIDYSLMGPNAYFQGSGGTYSYSSVTISGKTYNILPLTLGEDVFVELSDNGQAYFNTAFYSSNAFTLKMQSSADAVTWADTGYSFNSRGTYFWTNTTITVQPTGSVYYRAVMVKNWPLTVTDGSTSSSDTTTDYIMGRARVDWP